MKTAGFGPLDQTGSPAAGICSFSTGGRAGRATYGRDGGVGWHDGEQTAIYEEFYRHAFLLANDFVGLFGQDYITQLSSGDLRGTNPDNAAHRYHAAILEAWRIRDRSTVRPYVPPRPTRRSRSAAR
jgi:hypothetical protein